MWQFRKGNRLHRGQEKGFQAKRYSFFKDLRGWRRIFDSSKCWNFMHYSTCVNIWRLETWEASKRTSHLARSQVGSMGELCHQTKEMAAMGFMASIYTLHLSTTLQPCPLHSLVTQKIPMKSTGHWTQDLSREKLFLTHKCQTYLKSQPAHRNSEELRAITRAIQHVHKRHASKNQVSPSSDSALTLVGRQSHQQQYSRRTSLCCIVSCKFKHKKILGKINK